MDFYLPKVQALNISDYDLYKCPFSVSFSNKLNLVFGTNGVGKTTFLNIFQYSVIGPYTGKTETRNYKDEQKRRRPLLDRGFFKNRMQRQSVDAEVRSTFILGKDNYEVWHRLDDTLLANCPEEILLEELAHGKQRGCQFNFSESQFRDPKSIIVHMDEQDTLNKLLMVVKTCFDEKLEETFWHIELETLPYITGNKQKHVITTFLHGMYYPKRDVFTHIDFTKNQYNIDIYQEKYADSKTGVPIDQYTENSDLHYKIWCIEDGEFSKEEWYKLIKVSLDYEYQVLFDEMFGFSDISLNEQV